jgi:hypothetical protein
LIIPMINTQKWEQKIYVFIRGSFLDAYKANRERNYSYLLLVGNDKFDIIFFKGINE